MTVEEVIVNLIISVVGGIFSAVLTVFLLNFYNKFHLRKMLLKDRVFTDALDEIRVGVSAFLSDAGPILKYYDWVEWYNYPGKGASGIPWTQRTKKGDNGISRIKGTERNAGEAPWAKDAIKSCVDDVHAFCVENTHLIVDMVNRTILNPQSEVIFEMIDKTFGILNDFKLVGIANNLKSSISGFEPIDENYLLNEEKVKVELLMSGILEFVGYFYDLVDYLKLREEYDKMHFETEAKLDRFFSKYPV